MPIPAAETENNRPDLAHYIENDPQTIYEFLDRPDLTEEDVELTQETYDTQAQLYSLLEWSQASIDRVWTDIFEGELQDMIKSLPEGARVLVPGCGTGKDACTVSLLNRKINVYASDLSLPMLKEGINRINWVQIVTLAKIIFESGANTNGTGWITKIVNYYFMELNNELPDLEKHLRESVLKSLQSRLTFVQARLEDQLFPSETLDMVISIANLQHLPDELLLSTIESYIDMLKPGGVFHFNLRLDLGPMTVLDKKGKRERKIGRVFRDNALDNWRYYNTVSNQEVGYLEAYLRKKLGGRISMYIRSEEISYHPHNSKPAFQNIRIVKNY